MWVPILRWDEDYVTNMLRASDDSDFGVVIFPGKDNHQEDDGDAGFLEVGILLGKLGRDRLISKASAPLGAFTGSQGTEIGP